MNQLPARVSIADLRLAVVALSALMGAKGPAASTPLAADYRLLLRRLTRASSCPDLDNLADALRAAGEVQAAVEAQHVFRPIAGIASLRQAFSAIESWADQVELAEPGQDTPPDAALDIPLAGVLAALLVRNPRTRLVAVPRPRAVAEFPELRHAA
jgi:hypothetical protein